MRIYFIFWQKGIQYLIMVLIFCGLQPRLLQAQVAGSNTYDFLNLINSARVVAMGGDFLAINDDDITLTLSNPSLINAVMRKHLSLSFVDYYSDINYGFVAFSQTFEKYGSFVGSIQFVNYGKFNYADDTGLISGRFGASELSIQVGWGKLISSNWSVGSNLKYVYSAFEGYKSYGIAIDFAGSYIDVENGFTSSLIVKNMGWQIRAYRIGNHEGFPFEVEFGLSKRPQHMPFRYSILINHLNKWDLSYQNPYADNNSYELIGNKDQNANSLKFSDQLFRHVVIGGELLLSENFSLRLGYNYRRRKELGLETKLSTVGFSWGFEFKISRFRLSYARSAYHLVGSPNYLTITTNISEFFNK